MRSNQSSSWTQWDLRKKCSLWSVFDVTWAFGMSAIPLRPSAALVNAVSPAGEKQVCIFGVFAVIILYWKMLLWVPLITVSPGDLDIKTLGCVKAEECGVENTVEFFSNNTIYVMTKHCCSTPFCNSAPKLQITTLFYLAVAVLTTWYLTEASTASC